MSDEWRGSVAELETQLIIAVELGYGTPTQVQEAFELVSQLWKMLNARGRKLLTR
jgi:four helix bundle protein